MKAGFARYIRGCKYNWYKRYVYPRVYAADQGMARRIAFFLLNYQPRLIKLHVNHECNLQCKGCYCRPTDTILTKNEIFGFLDDLCAGSAARPLRFDILGGEPLLREDLDEIIAYAARRKRIDPVSMYTNATLCDEQRACLLRKAGLHVAIVTLHSQRADLHDSITGIDGSWRKTVAGIRALAQAGIRTYTFTIIMSDNICALDEIDSCARQLGAKTIFHRYMPQSAEDPLCVRDITGYQRSVEWMRSRSQAHQEKVFRLAWWRNKICPAFVGLVNIQPDGVVTPCPFVKKIVLGNIRNEPFHRIMRNAYTHSALQEFLSIPEDCSRCVFKTQCAGGCKASGYGIGMAALAKDMYCQGPYTDTSANKEPEKCIPYFY